MRITLNFADAEFPEPALTVLQVMERRRFSFPLIITRLNGILVPRDERGTTIVRDGDNLELYHLVSGG